MSNPRVPNGYGEVLGPHDMSPLSTPGYIDRLYDLAVETNRPVILNIVLRAHEYDHDFETQLLGCFPNFPIHLLADIYESSTWGRGTVVLPNTTDARYYAFKLTDMSIVILAVAFLANYPQVQGATCSQSKPEDEMTPAQVNFLPILCWCSSVERLVAGSQQSTQRIAIVVTISFHACVPEKMGKFWSIERRQDRLVKFEQWAFLDLAATFSGWPTIWTNARRELAQRHASMYSSANAVADLSTTRIIHQDMANVIAFREDLRLSIAGYAKYSQILRRMFPNNKMARINKMRTLTGIRRKEGQPMDEAELKERTEMVELLAELENRLQDSQQNLEHQLETSEVILRQLENLLSLAFNTQAIAQGQATAMLNVLATIFLPLSFVASVFGMTKFEISAVWYPPAATLVLFLVGGTILLIRWLGVDMSIIRLPAKPGATLISKQQNPTFRLLNTGPQADTPTVCAEMQEQRGLGLKGLRSQETVESALYSLGDAFSLSTEARQQPATLGKLGLPQEGDSFGEIHSDDVKPGKPDDNAHYPPSEEQIQPQMEDTQGSLASKPAIVEGSASTTLSHYPPTKPRLTKSETELLEGEFQKTQKPSSQRKSEIADLLQVEKPRINNWFQNRRVKEKQVQRTRMLEAQPIAEQSNAKILHGGQTAHGPKAPNNPSFESVSSLQHFRTPQDYRVTGGGVPQLAANAASQLQQLHSLQAQTATISSSANGTSLPARDPKHVLRDIQMQVMLLEQQNEKRPKPQKEQRVDGPPSCPPARHSTHALADYQKQLMLLEQQNKKRLMMARLEVDIVGSRDAACAQVGKSNSSNVDDPPEPQMEQRIDPPSCQQDNQLAGAGIVPAVVRDA
ncbi:homeobox transcription factor [Fusarium denticulatum]|uniref:Homeobox transcription factor n=1 Tax=Fusarium denticulatum TaxID=48507 RepID=A0A8H5TDG2_9HYPO|nr:homeobox transcription factor [Fusarium denticulatum]